MEQKRIFQLLADFMDDDSDFDLLDDFEKESSDDFFNHFLNTFKKTVELCHHMEMLPVTKTLHYKIIHTIENYDRKPATTTKRKKNLRTK